MVNLIVSICVLVKCKKNPDSLDLLKNQILARNLFLTVWYAYRIQKKLKLTVVSKDDLKEIDVDSRLTDFQKFIKFLIEFDGIENPENNKIIKSQISSIINSMLSSSEQQNTQRKEKEVCLFLRRVCLVEHFLLDNDVNPNENEIIDWDEILSTANLKYMM